MNVIEPNEIKNLIMGINTKTKENVVDKEGIESYLIQYLLPKKISINAFYSQLIELLFSLMQNLVNSVSNEDFYQKNYVALNYFYKVIDIFICIKQCCINDLNEILSEDFINNSILIIFNVFIKIIESKKKYEKNSINTFLEHIYKIVRVLLDIKSEIIIKITFSSNIYLDYFIQKDYSRIILYDILEKILSYEKSEVKEVELIDEKKKNVINYIMQYLIKNCNKDDAIIIIQDIKRISLVYKRRINIIHDGFIDLIKKILDYYDSSIKDEYDKLFFFFR